MVRTGLQKRICGLYVDHTLLVSYLEHKCLVSLSGRYIFTQVTLARQRLSRARLLLTYHSVKQPTNGAIEAPPQPSVFPEFSGSTN